ncbi:M23 family metallopeptidase [Xanthomonas sacchari]|uniref:M23 family metallopeptidase n=1 Tax=Xanthomonas sacchari TaxID=56458 RepID=UPI0027D8904C|nr:M23 family metallopeptidase [Xanthomonas sacchari]
MPAPSGVVTSVYGWRFHPVFKYWRPHRGVDLRAGVGTQLVATHSGVVQVSNSASGGNEIRIVGDNGWVTRYLHLTRPLVAPGTKVSAGQAVALSGNTGHASAAPHLHLELYGSEGKDLNPEPLLCPSPSRKPGAEMSNGFPVSACNPKGGSCSSAGVPPANGGGPAPGEGQTPPATGYAGKEPASPAPNISQFDDMSVHEILSSEVIKRHGNPDWYRLESERGAVALLTEQAQMRALRLYMRYLNKESRDRIEATLAAKVQRKVRSDADERIARQREVAGKAANP